MSLTHKKVFVACLYVFVHVCTCGQCTLLHVHNVHTLYVYIGLVWKWRHWIIDRGFEACCDGGGVFEDIAVCTYDTNVHCCICTVPNTLYMYIELVWKWCHWITDKGSEACYGGSGVFEDIARLLQKWQRELEQEITEQIWGILKGSFHLVSISMPVL